MPRVALLALLLASHSPAADPPLAGAVIVVDAGHGGQAYSKSYTGGTRGVNSKLTESALNLKVAFELEKALKAAGATVHMTRVADHRLSREGSSNTDELHARIDFFEHHNCHFFLSVHHNAGGPTATGHTALYKHNAADDTLYEGIAAAVNDSLVGAVPGRKLALIKGSYHILRETDIPGTIAESGFLTNPDFDTLANTPAFPKAEADAIAAGAVKYWTTHKKALVAGHDKRAKTKPDATKFTAVALNPKLRDEFAKLASAAYPVPGPADPTDVGKIVANYAERLDPKVKFAVTARCADGKITLAGSTDSRPAHDKLIDTLVALKLYPAANAIALPAK